MDGVTANADLDLATNTSQAVVKNGLTLNNSTIRLGNGAGSTNGDLFFDGTQSLGGTGTVRFGKSGSNALYVSYNNDNSTLTIGSGITVRGSSGSLTNYYSGTIVNQGTVLADDSGGTSFSYDSGFAGGSGYPTASAIDTSASNAAPADVYQSVRYGYNFGYTLGGLTAGNSYTVRLHFADLLYTAVNQAKFDVAINGTMGANLTLDVQQWTCNK